MAYDIYGQNLRHGYCEVHPHVNQSYPCQLCYTENDRRQSEKDYYNNQEREYYAEMEKQHNLEERVFYRLHNASIEELEAAMNI